MPAARKLAPVESRQVTVEFDPENLTIGEIEQFEEMTGDDFDAVFAPQPILVDGKPLLNGAGEPMFRQTQKTKHLKAVLYLMLKRNNPQTTMADVEAMSLSSLMPSRPDPTDPTGPQNTPSSAPSTA